MWLTKFEICSMSNLFDLMGRMSFEQNFVQSNTFYINSTRPVESAKGMPPTQICHMLFWSRHRLREFHVKDLNMTKGVPSSVERLKVKANDNEPMHT
jgi:hypothetical protein